MRCRLASEIRTLIVDDEPLARRGIRQLLAAHRDVVVVGECRDGREALRALETLQPDLVFLDVQMPGLDGLGVVRARGPDRMPLVVFVTAYDQFAVRAFDAHALDYLVKPLSQARFEATLARVREQARLAGAIALASRLTALLTADEARRVSEPLSPGRRRTAGLEGHLVVSTTTGKLMIDVAEIDWIEAQDYTAWIHVGDKRHLIRESLASLEKRLDPAHFMRVHRSAIVRLDQVREFRSRIPGEATLILRDGTRVPVSRRKRERLAALLRHVAS